MYKSNLSNACRRLALISGGTISGLLDAIQQTDGKLRKLVDDIAAKDESLAKSGRNLFRESFEPLRKRIAEISPLATGAELNRLGVAFDSVLEESPELETLLRPGRQALAALTGAFDVVLQQHSRVNALNGLLEPGMALASNCANYSALSNLFVDRQDGLEISEAEVSIEASGTESLYVFAAYVTLLADLANIATRAAESIEGSEYTVKQIKIVSIDTGSPIQIKLKGDGRTIRFFLSMFRDAVRHLFLHLTAGGRTVLAMQTRALAKEMGIDKESGMLELDNVVKLAAEKYARTFQAERVVVAIDGEIIKPNSEQSVPSPSVQIAGPETSTPLLKGTDS